MDVTSTGTTNFKTTSGLVFKIFTKMIDDNGCARC